MDPRNDDIDDVVSRFVDSTSGSDPRPDEHGAAVSPAAIFGTGEGHPPAPAPEGPRTPARAADAQHYDPTAPAYPEGDPDLSMEPVVNTAGGRRSRRRAGLDRTTTILLSAAGVALVVLIIAATIFMRSGGGGGEGNTPPAFTPPAQTVADTAAPAAVEEKMIPADPTFSWWGDGLSVVASQYEPVLGASGHDYYWNASNSISVEEAIDTLATSDDEKIGGTVVWAFGNNSEVTEYDLSRLQTAIGGDRALVLVGVGTLDPEIIPWAYDVNRRYAALAEGRPGTYYVDWQDYIDDNPNFVRDGFVLTREGTAAWANAINYAVLGAYKED